MISRVGNVVELGYTAAQAAFLELCSLQSGYFVLRHFNGFIQRRSGALAQVFIERALEKGHIECLSKFGNRHLYHTSGQALFRALGDAGNRNRREHKRVTVRRRLMALDYCLSSRGEEWLLTEHEKISFFLAQGATEADLPSEQFGASRRYFVDKQPVSFALDGAARFAFIDSGQKGLSQWEAFLRSHRLLLRQLAQPVLVYAGAQPERFVPAERVFRRIVTGASESGEYDTARLRQHFESRKLFEERRFEVFNQLRLDEFREDRKVFFGERIDAFYQAWLATGDVAAEPSEPRGIQFRTQLLSHRYAWISPINGEERRGSDALNSIAGEASS